MPYQTLTGCRFTTAGNGNFFVAGDALEPTESERADGRRLQDEWLSLCERNMGLAPGTSPVRAAVTRHRADEDARALAPAGVPVIRAGEG